MQKASCAAWAPQKAEAVYLLNVGASGRRVADSSPVSTLFSRRCPHEPFRAFLTYKIPNYNSRRIHPKSEGALRIGKQERLEIVFRIDKTRCVFVEEVLPCDGRCVGIDSVDERLGAGDSQRAEYSVVERKILVNHPASVTN